MTATVTLDIDGPRTPEYTLEVAEALSEAVRVLCHLTLGHASFSSPADVDRLLRSLEAAAAGLDQLLRQVSGWLAAERQEGRITVEGTAMGTTPGAAVYLARERLEAARVFAGRLRAALASAAGITADLAGTS